MKRKTDNYMSGTIAKYFQNNDIMGYYLKLYNINSVDDLINYYNKQNKSINNNSSTISVGNKIENNILLRGIKYENHIIDKLQIIAKKKKLSFVKIVEDKPEYKHYNKYLKQTNFAIKNNVDIIYQGLIQCSHKDYKLRGFPDLLVSKKAFNKLFFNFIDKVDNDTIKTVNEMCDYIVVDIKSSNIALNVDGCTARNTDLLRAYKSQLALYGKIMTIRHKIPCPTYILPYTLKLEYSLNGSKHEKTFVNNMSDKFHLVKVDIYNKDKYYFDQIKQNYKQFLKCNGSKNISFLFPQQEQQFKSLTESELIDIKNGKKNLDFDVNYISKKNIEQIQIPIVRGGMIERHDIKRWIATQTKSLSLLRGFNTNDIIELKKNGIFSYLQQKEILDWYEQNKQNKHDYNIIKSILHANVPNTIIYCDDYKYKLDEMTNNIINNKFVCCLDFETIPTKLINATNNFDMYKNYDIKQKIFMIGVTIYLNINRKLEKYGEYQVYLDNIIFVNDEVNINILDNDVICMFNKLKKYIYSTLGIFTENPIDKKDVVFLVWSSFEQNIMKQIQNFYDYNDDNKKLYDIEIIDLLKVFTDNKPIGINGAFDYSIKSIANGYRINGLLDDVDYWQKKDVTNGFNAMYYALLHYLGDLSDWNKFEQIKKYNLVDCRIMANIVNITYSLLKKKTI